MDDLWRAGCGALVGYEPGEAALSHEEIRVAPTEEIEDLLNRIDFRVIPLPDLPHQQAELEPGSFRPATPEPAWSPDSTRIAFSADNEQGDQEVWVIDIDGSNLVNLTDGLGGDYPAWQPVSPSATTTSVEAQSWGRIKALLSTDTR
ncbi:MAG: hypothetical protein F4X17_04680 [Gemmatimonadetes bacterium]|nr:hypothetical protein [Gemmatimonadota bacterium]